MATGMKRREGDKSQVYQRLADDWQLIDDLLGGTSAMRKAASRWLPREPKEEDIAYAARLGRSILYNGLSTAIDDICSKPFSRPPVITGNLGEKTTMLLDDANAEGDDLNNLMLDAFRTALKYGGVYILVQSGVTSDDAPSTLAEERERGVHPLLEIVEPPSVVYWEFDENATTGVRTLVKIEIASCTYRGDEEYERIRVYTKTDWAVKERKKNTDEWTQIAGGTHAVGAVPLVQLYFKAKDLMQPTPPLIDLAWLNLAHWQSNSDQRNILRFMRIGLWFLAGVSKEDASGISIGAAKMIVATNPSAHLSVVEHSGAAAKIGEDDLKSIEARMQTLGVQPFLEAAQDVTAFANAASEARKQSKVQSWIGKTESAIEDAIEMASGLAGETIPEDFSIRVFRDFGVGLRAGTDVPVLIQLRAAGDIDRKTELEEIKRRGVLSDDVDVDLVIQAVEDEQPAMPQPDMNVGPDGQPLDNAQG